MFLVFRVQRPSVLSQPLFNQIRPDQGRSLQSGSIRLSKRIEYELILELKTRLLLLLQVPDGVTVLMSASRSSYSKQDRVFQFSMEFPVPSYLVALVAGELQHVDVGPRSVTLNSGLVPAVIRYCYCSSADLMSDVIRL